MAPLENGARNARIALNPQRQALDFQQASAREGKEATEHDFLSLGGNKRSPTIFARTTEATTEDLLHPLERNAKPVASGGRSRTMYSVGPQASYALVNGTMGLPSISRYKAIVEESMKGDIFQMIEVKNSYDVKGSTPRSKHSATEQRRRSKINDRFQMLRQLLPSDDQKRDKASFLLEVIQYIQMLQEKVNYFEMAEHGRLQERANKNPSDARIPLETKTGPVLNGYAKNYMSPLRAACENEGSGLGPVLALHSRLSQGPAACQSSYESKPLLHPLSSSPTFPVSAFEKMCTPEAASKCADLQTTEASSSMKGCEKDAYHAQAPCGEGSKVDDQEPPTVHGGFISISSTYSQGLLDTLTRALQSSGLDLTQATVSVQIDLGKQGGGVITGSSKVATLDTGSPQSQIKESRQSPDAEHINKRPKFEVDV